MKHSFADMIKPRTTEKKLNAYKQKKEQTILKQ